MFTLTQSGTEFAAMCLQKQEYGGAMSRPLRGVGPLASIQSASKHEPDMPDFRDNKAFQAPFLLPEAKKMCLHEIDFLTSAYLLRNVDNQ